MRGLGEAAWAALSGGCPFETATYEAGVVRFEHEGAYVEAEACLRELAGALGPDGEGHADVIDNEAWTVSRYRIFSGNFEKQTFDIDDVLEESRNVG